MTPLIAFSVSNSPDLDRLGLFERSFKLTESFREPVIIHCAPGNIFPDV